MKASFVNPSAQVIVNGWLSAPFPIQSGVRQGDPLAPTLFVLALELLARRIRKSVSGYTHSAKPRDILFREMLFADDMVCFITDRNNLLLLNDAISLYQSASSGRLSRSKSFVYPMGKHRATTDKTINDWIVSKIPFRYLGVQIGLDVDNRAMWQTIVQGTISRMRTIPMWDLPVHTRCAIVNRYCYSKLWYYAKFVPLPDDLLSMIEEATTAALFGRKDSKSKIALSTLTHSLDTGGFGLTNLRTDLDFRQARHVFNALQQLLAAKRDGDEERLEDHQTYLFSVIQSEANYARDNLGGHRYKWTKPRKFVSCGRTFVTGEDTFEAEWTWQTTFYEANLGKAPVYVNPAFYRSSQHMRQALPARMLAWMESWRSWVRCRISARKIKEEVGLGPALWLDARCICLGFNDQEVKDTYFRLAGRQARMAVLPAVTSKWDDRLSLTTEERNVWWSLLSKIRRKLAAACNSIHLLSLNYLDYEFVYASTTRSRLATETPTTEDTTRCPLCRRELDCLHPDVTQGRAQPFWEHVLRDCKVSIDVWTAAATRLGNRDIPPLREFICAPKQPTRCIAMNACYVHKIVTIIRSRKRFESPQDTRTPVSPSKAARHGSEVARQVLAAQLS